uniref:Putative vacuolar protein sorting-associated protein 13A n=1 Tax=Noccaea caerulescens TaxID=107243 RepID=A0A1J3IIE4_NOCCA
MLEDQVAYLLQRYLGNYVRGLNKEALKISVWQGDVELKNMQLKPEALNALKLPVKVKAGFLGSVKLKVPWSRLGQEPVVVYLDRIYVLAEPATDVEGCSEDSIQEKKRKLIREMETKLVERARRLHTEMNKSWMGSLVDTVMGNLKLSISNIHIRYEDLESNPGHPFSAGVTLEKLLAVTVDENGKETFVTGGTLASIQKSVELDRLAFYLDSDMSPWHIDKPWEDLLPFEWDQIFRFGTKDGKPAESLSRKHFYILQPVSGNAKYSKSQANGSSNTAQPLQKAYVNLDDVTLCLSKGGYRDVMKLADNFAAFNQRLKYAHYRPSVSVKIDARSWWKYAFRVVSEQVKIASGRMSWEHVLKYTSLRKRYITHYASLLKSDISRTFVDDNEEIEALDRELDTEVILQWRMLAHKFVERSIQAENDSRTQQAKSSWWPFGGKSQVSDGEGESVQFTAEDWERLNKVIGYKEGDDQSTINNAKPDALHTFVEVHMRRNASKLYDGEKECLAELSCEDLNCSIKLFPETKIADIKLGRYRLSSPSGLLAESAPASHSVLAVFCYKPFDAKVDWSLVAKASPCYMTYLKDSIDGIVNFFESSTAVSQTIALETAAAVQSTIDEVRRTAQQGMNKALKDHARFLLDLDIAAPKITIPTEFRPDNHRSTKLLLDLGNLVIRSQDDYKRELSEEMNMYLQFDLVLSDVSALLVDGDYAWKQLSSKRSSGSGGESSVTFLPVIDKCGVLLKLQQIRRPNPSYPSTRLAVRLPSIGFHFSPARYHRLMQVAQIFQTKDDESSHVLRPWEQADFEGWVSILSWKGREATWQRRYLCLVGPFIYVLESPGSKSYKQYSSLRGKHMYKVPVELAGGVEHVMSIRNASRVNEKVMEDVNALILMFDSEDSRKTWHSRLQGAVYRASGSAPIAGLSDTSSDSEDSETEQKEDVFDLSKLESVYVTGVLDELKICFSYGHQHDASFMAVLLARESKLFEFRAIGGKVEVSMRGSDMFIGTVLKSLEIEDLVSRSGSNESCYLARSFIQSSVVLPSFEDAEIKNPEESDLTSSEGEEKFYEAPEILVDSIDYTSLRTPSFSRIDGLLPVDNENITMPSNEATESLDSFVKAQIVIYHQTSPQYNNIDNQVTVSLATLSFFCRRPTILAILEFVNAINVEDPSCESFEDSSPVAGEHISPRRDGFEISRDAAVKGLLGKGKSRIIFNLALNMARAQIFLMNENGTKFATLSQDNLLTDIKVFPNSFSITASLGNLRISDDSLPSNHMYFWICDMRDPGGTSFVELAFTSFSIIDEDHEGFDYCLSGQLSEVRIVYLNRFIQEVAEYFMGLVPSDSKGVVKMKDQITDSEKWFTTSEIEGSPALKLDLSLKKPIIVMPRHTESPDYLKLDVVHITVNNTFQWFAGDKNELNAVHMETMKVMVMDINLNVGSGAEIGESIIQDVKGVSVTINRSLRDLLHQIPSIEVSIEIEELRAALSNREYQILTECAQSNISEVPHTVPPLSGDIVASSRNVPETLTSEDPNAAQTEKSDAWISMKVSVVINLVELCLYAGTARDAPLAAVQITGGWLLYKSNTHGDGFLTATLKGFSVIDNREGTEKEFRLAVGRPADLDFGDSHSLTDGDQGLTQSSVTKGSDIRPLPSMLTLDAQFGQSSTFVSVCIQRPQLLVALDFLLAVVEFFVPTIGSVLSSEEDKNLNMVDAIIMDQSVYKQQTAEAFLSPMGPLIVEDEKFDDFVYDGNGGTLYLKDRHGGILSSPSTEPIIYVGNGKKLQFRNIVFKNGQVLDSCISLGAYSSYSVSREDGVELEVYHKAPQQDNERKEDLVSQSPSITTEKSTEMIIEFQAIGPELTFYNTSKDVVKTPLLSNKLLHAQLDAYGRVIIKNDEIEMSAHTLGLTMESNGVKILEPFDTSIKYSSVSGRTNIRLSVSNIFMNFSFSILRLFIAVEEDILSFLRMTSRKMTVVCSEYDKIGTIRNPCTDQIYAFWRPHPPPGFASLGDYLTPLDKPPTKGVLVVNTNLMRVKRPLSFRLIWSALASGGLDDSSSMDDKDEKDNLCSVWFPEAPKGYVALSCVVSSGSTPPPLASVFCILASSVSPCSLRDCIAISSTDISQSSLAFWRVDNSVGSFLPADPSSLNLLGRSYELRHILFGSTGVLPKESSYVDVRTSPDNIQPTRPQPLNSVTSGQRFQAVASFELIWWNRGTGSQKKVSVWRPIVTEGMAYFGDVAVSGYEPPNSCVVLHDTGEQDILKAAVDFLLVGRVKKHRGVESISFWMPQAPPGFVSLGCVACKGKPKPLDFIKLKCARSDLVAGDHFAEDSLWDTTDVWQRVEPFSIWSIGNELKTFIVRSGLKKPPRRFALKLADQDLPGGTDNMVIHAEIGTFSAALFDDYGGLMVPLVNLSLNNISFGLLGKTNYTKSTINFSLAARSYNDKYEAWEPLIEPADAFLRYQFNPRSFGAVSELRLTSTKDLNVNVSVSNANTIIQAYASWNSLSNVHEYDKERGAFPLVDNGKSVIEVHQKKTYFIIPQNKLGQDIYIRATEIKGFKDIVKMPSGDMRTVKVPVLTNMLDSHLRGELCRNPRIMVTVIVMDAQLPRTYGLSSHQYTAVIRLSPNQTSPVESVLRQQSARTCGSVSNMFSSELEVVDWSEIFFFKIDALDDSTLELIVIDVGKGAPVGTFSAPLKQVARYMKDNVYQHNYANDLVWLDLSTTETMSMNQGDQRKNCGKIRCAVLLPAKTKVVDQSKSSGGKKSGFIQVSPSIEGPWTTVRLNYASPAACWRLGNDVVASEVSMHDGNRYVNVRSLVSVENSTDYLLDLCLKPKDNSFPLVSIGLLKPGDTLPVPLSGLIQSASYVLKLKCVMPDGSDEYSWSFVASSSGGPEVACESESEICISALTESEHLLCCTQISSNSSGDNKNLWFCLNTQATEIAKDIRSDPIQDWTLVVKSPFSIANCLPFGAEYSVLEKQTSGHFICHCRDVFGSGETVKVHTVDIRNPLYFSLLPQRGWLPMREAVLISHPNGVPAKTIGLRSSATGRIAQIILEQNYDEQQKVLTKMLRIYAPFWFSIARCPSLTLRLLDLSGKKKTRKFGFPFRNKKTDEVVLEEVTEEDIYEGHTIASSLNFKLLGLSVSISQSGNQQHGPAKDLSALGDMDGSLDVDAYDPDGKCMRLFLTTKPCAYQSVPTKIISVRPFMTFTNRIGEDIYIKLNSDDEPKVLHAYDSRVSFVFQPSGRDDLQVRLRETEWSFPVQVAREDTIVLVLRSQNGARRFLKAEIRGFEEGSRFIIVFRLGPSNGPMRVENRTTVKSISVRQSGFGEDSWVLLKPLTTEKFAWEDPYGQKFLDAKVESDHRSGIFRVDMENGVVDSELLRELEVDFHVKEIGDIKIARFTDDDSTSQSSHEIISLTSVGSHGYSTPQTPTEHKTTTLEFIIEMGLVGISLVDHMPKELSYFYLERVFVSYSTGYDEGRTSRFKVILGHLQIDNQLPLTLMPVILAPDNTGDSHQPVLKMTITMCNEETDGIQVYPYVYVRVTDNTWRLNIHEPIIWASADFCNKLQMDRLPQSSNVAQVDPEIHINLIDVSEVRLKVSLETAPAQRPHGILGVWSPILSAVGNAFKIQVHLRRVMHRDRFIRKSSILPAIGNRIWRDLIHNPLHLIFSVDVLGMTSSTLASLSKGLAALSTDGQFLQLREKQVWSRRITGVGDAFVQGTEALAQGVAFGVSGVVTKPVESARQNGILGFAHGVGRAFLGFIVQPVSGALDFFSLTVDGIGASCSRCVEILSNRTALERIRNPRAVHADGILREYDEKEAIGQMLLHLAEASRHFGCTEIFREPSKFALSDCYEEHFLVPYKRIVMVTNKRVVLLQCSDLDKMDKKPSKIMWEVPWEELMALELAKAGSQRPSHLILHLKNFQKSESFAQVIKCSVPEESDGLEPQAVRICSVVRKMWKAYQSNMKNLVLKVPSSQRHVYFAWNEADGRDSKSYSNKAIIQSRELSSSSSVSDDRKLVKHSINFSKIWSSERETKGRCTLCKKQVSEDGGVCTIWRPSCPEGFVSVGDVAHVGTHPPTVAAVYNNADRVFALPLGYDLVWRNCLDDYTSPVSIWHPRAPEGFVSPGCVAVADFKEPELNTVYCMPTSLAEQTDFEEQKVWSSPDAYPWACHIYQVRSDALHFMALRQTKEESDWRAIRVRDDYRSVESESTARNLRID